MRISQDETASFPRCAVSGDRRSRDYLTKIKYHIDHDAIGWNEDGRLMFVFRKGVIDQDVQNEAFEGLQQLDAAGSFWSCNKSHRPELQGAVGFNTQAATVGAKNSTSGITRWGEFSSSRGATQSLSTTEDVQSPASNERSVPADTAGPFQSTEQQCPSERRCSCGKASCRNPSRPPTRNVGVLHHCAPQKCAERGA